MRTDIRQKEDNKRDILERAARLFCDLGYEATSMQQVAAACGLTKAGLYHHVESKEALLAELMEYGMDIFDAEVYSRVVDIVDPVERLRECMQKNIFLCTRGWSREITVILHEHATLRSPAGDRIDARKKRYVRLLEKSFAEAAAQGLIRKVDPTIAAFSFLGTVLWIYKWFRTDGRLTDDALADGMIDLFFNGLAFAAPEGRGRVSGRGLAFAAPEGRGRASGRGLAVAPAHAKKGGRS